MTQEHNAQTHRKEHSGSERGRRGGYSVTHLLRELSGETSALLVGEVALAKTEIQENVTRAQRGVMSMAAGAAVLTAGILALVASAILGLTLFIPAWLSALIVGAAITIIGALMVAAGKKKASVETLRPDKTFDTLRDTRDFAREERHRAKEIWQ